MCLVNIPSAVGLGIGYCLAPRYAAFLLVTGPFLTENYPAADEELLFATAIANVMPSRIFLPIIVS